MITYIITSTTSLLTLLLVYKLFLENQKAVVYNRFYLLVSIVFSLILPLVKLDIWAKNKNSIAILAQENVMILSNQISNSSTDYQPLVIVIYFGVLAVFLFRVSLNLFKIYESIQNNKLNIINNLKIVLVPQNIIPYSFMNYIFINEAFYLNGKTEQILLHESAHVRQKHSLDIIFIEILMAIFWFHPIFYFYKKTMQLNHEFLADDYVLKQAKDVVKYQKIVLKFATTNYNNPLTTNFNYLVTKKRLIMMTQTFSRIQLLKTQLLIAPIFIGLFLFFSTNSFSQETIKSTQEVQVYNDPEVKPDFPGGIKEFYAYVSQNIKVKKNANGKLISSFVIEKDGSLTDIVIKSDGGTKMGDELKRILINSPKWKPGIQNGKPVRVQYFLPVIVSSQ